MYFSDKQDQFITEDFYNILIRILHETFLKYHNGIRKYLSISSSQLYFHNIANTTKKTCVFFILGRFDVILNCQKIYHISLLKIDKIRILFLQSKKIHTIKFLSYFSIKKQAEPVKSD